MNPLIRILHLEDSERDAELIRDRLEAEDLTCEITHVQDRPAFERALDQSQFDLVLCDYNLPSFNGLAALATVRTKQANVPAIIVSGAVDEEEAVHCLQRGAVDYLLKQRLERLVPAIKRALAEAQEQRKRRQVEARLTEERELGEAILNNMPSLFFLITEGGRFLRWNRQLEVASGYSGAEIAQRRALDFIAEPHQALVAGRLREAFATGRGEIEADLVTKQGDRRPFYFVGATVFMDGHPCLAGAGMDMTERKRAEQERLRLSTAMEQASDAVAITDRDGVIKYVNPAFEKVTGYPRQEALGQNPRLLKSGKQDKTFYQEMWQTLCAGEVWRGRCINKRKDGTLYEEEKTISPVRDATGTVMQYVAVGRDVTQELALEAQLRQAQKMEALGTLAGGVAHEINNPVNGIMNYAQLISDRLPEESPLRAFTAEITRETDRVAQIVQSLLTFARTGRPTRLPARPQDIVNDTLTLVRTVMRHDQITLTVEVPDDLPRVCCNSQQIQQVVMNLLTNARDALNEKYPEYDENKVIKISARPFDQNGKPWLRLTVEDHGPGIPEEIGLRVFDPFFTTKLGRGGTGLGLSISHGIVKEHGGEMRFETEPGRGTHFYVDLPVGEIEERNP